MFYQFLSQGFLHILDFNGLDHLLFLSVLGVVYSLRQWKELLWVLTAFTIAHSLSLAFALFGIFSLQTSLVEFLIPATILFTCMENLFFQHTFTKYKVVLAGLFGLIHGMGFSTLLKNLFMGMDYSPWITLLPFNLGIELAQIIIISILLLVLAVLYKLNGVSQIVVVRVLSVLIGIQSLVWMVQRYPF
jgi:hydrogenase/urease accessory protein HupE